MRLAIVTLLALQTAAIAQTSTPPAASPPSESRRLLDEGAKLYHAGQIDKSLEAYERAILLLGHQQRLDEAFAASMTAAAIERKAGRHIAAAERYRQLALNRSDHPRAAEAHRLAILAVADALRNALPAERLRLANAYENVLEEHLSRWPRGATADNARLWQGQLLLSHRAWLDGREAVREIEESSPDYPSAVIVIADSYEGELEQLSDASQPGVRQQRAALVAAATHQLLPIITGAHNRWPETWNDTRRHVALAIARMHLELSTEPSTYAERLLVAALDSLPSDINEPSKSPTCEWAATARALLVVALIRSGKLDEAQSLVSQLADASSQPLLQALRRIDQVLHSLPAEEQTQRRETAALALEILRLLDARGDDLDANTSEALGRYRANAALATGDQRAAIAEYAKLAAAAPGDEQVRLQYANVLTSSNSLDDQRSALAEWQKIEDQSRGGSESWRQARQSRIVLLKRLGQREDAEKLLRLTELLYPDWSGKAPQ